MTISKIHQFKMNPAYVIDIFKQAGQPNTTILEHLSSTESTFAKNIHRQKSLLI